MAFIFLFGDLLNWADWIMAVARRVIELGFTEGDVVGLSGLRVRGRNQRAGSNGRRCCSLIVRRRFLRGMLQR